MDIHSLFKIAIEKKASDLHLVVGLPPVLRIHGKLLNINQVAGVPSLDFVSLDNNRNLNEPTVNASFPVVTADDVKTVIHDLLNEKQRHEFYKNKEFDFSISLVEGRFRGNLSFEKDNPKLVARIINLSTPTLEDINMPPITKKLLQAKQGLILVTGPTGCGKSTTLAAMINYINTNRSSNIVTLEDPMEFLFKSKKSIITQRQLGTDMLTFANGLKHVLRQDPDVIMVGEMRDLETIATAITLAETGHLVLATLHTYSATQTVDRILDIFPPHQQSQISSQLSMTLKAVISQRLLPKVGGGRVAVREVMVRNDAVSNLIREHKIPQIKTVIETSLGDGMISFSRAIKELYNQDLISKEEAEAQMGDSSLSI